MVFIVNSPQLGLGKLLMHGPLAGTLVQTFIIIIFLCHICCDYLLKMLVDDGQSQHGELTPHDQVSTQRSSPVEELKGKGVRQLTVEHPLNGMADGGPTGFPTADDEPVVAEDNGDELLGSPVEDLAAGTKKLKKKKKQQKLGVAAVPKGEECRNGTHQLLDAKETAAMVFCGRRDFAHFRVASCLERCIAHLTPVLVMSKKYRALLRVGHDSFIGVYCNALR